MKTLFLTLALGLALIGSAQAGELGDAAAPLKISNWVKGKPVDLATLKGKQVAVVEFWATWCPPCRTSIPHLTEMQKKFKDVVFIGVTDEDLPTVRKFVDKMGDEMDYTVAIDDKDQTSDGYMKAFDINGIPHAFVVDTEGRILWQGHPMGGLEETLEKIVAGKYDLETAKAEAKELAEIEKRQAEAQTKLKKLADLISQGRDDEETKKLETELMAMQSDAGGVLGKKQFDPADFRKRILFGAKVEKYQKAAAAGADTNEMASLEKELVAEAPEGFNLEEFKSGMAAEKEAREAGPLLQSYLEAVGENGDPSKAAELGKKVEALDLKNPLLLNQIAWVILTEDAIKHRDLNLALKLAKRAVDNSDAKNVGILDTYARALFDTGDVAGAVAQQQKAVNLAEEDIKDDLAATLKKYQAKAAGKN